ncbi:uncharacterized protein [Arachis hypogaea]|uniref:uncharacterized protein n=1 Tax=Arachis hypogaea TaxID=3818 RepID=UPI003B213147
MVSEREDPTMADNLANPNASPSSNSAADFENFTAFMRQFSQFQAHLGRSSLSSAISDPISPYFLHLLWSHDMWRALRSKNKVKFLDGSILKPGEGDPNFEAWDRCNNFLLSWINLSLSPEIAKSVMWISSAPDLWNDLKRRYSQGDVFRVGALKEEFYALKQGDLTVTSYFAMLKAIWEELENLRAIPSCVACVNGCSCGLRIVRDYASEKYVVKFLKGLNEQYSNVKSQIMLMKPLPEINTVLSMLTQQEQELNCYPSNSNIVTNSLEVQTSTGGGSFSGRGRGRGRNSGRGGNQKSYSRGYTSKFCSYCNRIGHLAETCYKKNGFPTHQKQRVANQLSTDEIVENSSAEIADSNQDKKSDDTVLVLTPDQKETLLALLQQPRMPTSNSVNHITSSATLTQPTGRHCLSVSSNFTKTSWILDSGATDHASYIQESFKTFHYMRPVLVNLPDGSTTTTNICGTVLPSLKMIGQAKVIGDLYVMDAQPWKLTTPEINTHSVNVTVQQDLGTLWHARLDQPSIESSNFDPFAFFYNNSAYTSSYEHTHGIIAPHTIHTTPDLSATSTSPMASLHDITDSASPATLESASALAPLEHSSIHIESQSAAPVLRRSERERKTPSYLKDFHCFHISSHRDSINAAQLPSTCKYPLSHHLSYSLFTPKHQAFTFALINNSDPKYYSEAVMHDCWRKAIEAELTALEQNKTWIITSLPPGKNAVGCKWIFRTKFNPDGTIERHKARLVAQGFTQIPGVDYIDTFSPVVKMSTVRVLLTVAAAKNWHLHQLDVNTAFLHGDLHEDIYMKLPKGLQCSDPNLVCKLTKSLYGLKQASRQWNIKLSAALADLGFTPSENDHSLFTKSTSTTFTAILVYVDDLVLAGDDLSEIQAVKMFLDDKFKIKDLGLLKFFIGMEVARNNAGIALYQRKYALDLITDCGLLGAKPASTPMEYTTSLSKASGSPLPDATIYRRLVGRLLYLTNTRPDLSYSVGCLSQFMDSPTDAHLKAAYRIIRYLKQSPATGLFFCVNNSFTLSGYTDSDWGACKDTRKSISGYCFFLDQTLISWKSKKQATVSRSSSEAEYRALANGTCELVWLLKLLKEFNILPPLPVDIFCDNKSAIYIASNPVFHERTKHVEVDCHVARNKFKEGVSNLRHVVSSEQRADLFTKSLPPGPFSHLLSKLGLLDLHKPRNTSLRGDVT